MFTKHPRYFVIITFLIALLAVGVSPALAVTLPSGFVDSVFGGALSNATAMEFAPDGRLFVLQQAGQVKIIKNGALLGTNFASLTVDSNGERGLLGIAFDPAFTTNNYLYLYYTVPGTTAHNRISRFIANGDVVTANSETVLIDLENLTGATNHNGGAMHFGNDGKLYVAVGENATSSNAQSFSNRLGKMLRYNSDGTIPSDNPTFGGQTTGANRAIWAMGLRNPYTFAFKPGTSKMHINDVGQNTWEEINDGIAGSNYGWPTTEGAFTPASFPTLKNPFYWYNHNNGSPTGCAITGGTFYNPTTVQFPSSYVDKYFFADYCGDWIYYVDPSATSTPPNNPPAVTQFATGLSAPVDLKVGTDGALYYLQRSGVHKIGYPAGAVAPTISQHPTNQTVSVGNTATFTVSASGTPPLTYQWQKNNVDIPGATSASYTTPATVSGDNGATFRCVVTNAFGSTNSNSATLTVIVRQPPTATITSPVDSSLFVGNQVITYSATASDAVDGTLPASAYSWTITLHHDAHTHPFLGPITGVTNGTFTIPTTGHPETTIWYRVTLTVTNTAGLTYSTFADVDPTLVNITLQTNPPGLNVTIDGQPSAAPVTFPSVVGIVRNIGVTSPQVLIGKTYLFTGWSDSGARSHDVSTPNTATTYTASFNTQVDTIGVYRNGGFFLRNSNSAGNADIVVYFGAAGWLPVTGDWNGDGIDTLGVYDPATGVMYLRNSNTPGNPDYIFAFGSPGDKPFAGRWDNTMTGDGVGVYRSSNGVLYMRRSVTTGFSDYFMIFGNPGDVPLAGDWDGTGYDSPGILRPSNNTFYLTNVMSNGLQFSDYAFTIPGADQNPVAGDWMGTGSSRAGYAVNGGVYLRSLLTTGSADNAFTFGNAGDLPVAGRWTAGTLPPPANLIVRPGNGDFTNGGSGGAE